MWQQVWQRVWPEAKVIFGIAGSITAALYIKRGIEKLTGLKLIDPNILNNGLAPKPASAPATPVNGNGTSAAQSSFSLASRKFMEGKGSEFVRGLGVLHYDRKWNTCDGYTLYEHNRRIRSDHTEGPCPLLVQTKGCRDCDWYVKHRSYSSRWEEEDYDDGTCTALLWLEKSQGEYTGLNQFDRETRQPY